MQVSIMSELENCFQIIATSNKRHDEISSTYQALIKLFEGRKEILILQDFRRLETVLSLVEFDAILRLCKAAGVKKLRVATLTHDMSRAFTGVLVQEISEKYGINLELNYGADVEMAKNWLRTVNDQA